MTENIHKLSLSAPGCKELAANRQDKETVFEGETILLVDDESILLEMTASMLDLLGYKVLMADNPYDAICIADKSPERIDLLLTDIVMQGMNGLELAKQLLEMYPNLKCVYMSGYTADIAYKNGFSINEKRFMQKPFMHDVLAEKIKSAIEES